MIDISSLYSSPASSAAVEAESKEMLRKSVSRKEETFQQLLRQAGLADPDADAEASYEEADIIGQLADPDSAFYQDMFQRMRLQLEESDEEKKKQAIIDALGAILDGMRSTDGAVRKTDMVSSMAGLSKQISELDADDPRREQLELFRQRLNQLGIFVDLDLGVKGGKDKETGWQTLTQYLIGEENQSFDPSIFDLI